MRVGGVLGRFACVGTLAMPLEMQLLIETSDSPLIGVDGHFSTQPHSATSLVGSRKGMRND